LDAAEGAPMTVESTDLAAVRADWAGREFDRSTFVAEQDKMLAWADACGETEARFTDPADPDFQAHPGFALGFSARWMLPPDFPQIGNGSGIDGGKTIDVLAPIRPGDQLSAVSTVADIYDKTGRSGTMVFIVHRMAFVNQAGIHVATVDTKMIRQMG
jgi:hypothetical protein